MRIVTCGIFFVFLLEIDKVGTLSLWYRKYAIACKRLLLAMDIWNNLNCFEEKNWSRKLVLKRKEAKNANMWMFSAKFVHLVLFSCIAMVKSSCFLSALLRHAWQKFLYNAFSTHLRCVVNAQYIYDSILRNSDFKIQNLASIRIASDDFIDFHRFCVLHRVVFSLANFDMINLTVYMKLLVLLSSIDINKCRQNVVRIQYVFIVCLCDYVKAQNIILSRWF